MKKKKEITSYGFLDEATSTLYSLNFKLKRNEKIIWKDKIYKIKKVIKHKYINEYKVIKVSQKEIPIQHIGYNMSTINVLLKDNKDN